MEIEIIENTTNVRHCNTSDDCYKIYRDVNMECVTQTTSVQKRSHGTSFGICKYPGCKRNNDNCYHGELCIKNNCVPVSEVICYELSSAVKEKNKIYRKISWHWCMSICNLIFIFSRLIVSVAKTEIVLAILDVMLDVIFAYKNTVRIQVNAQEIPFVKQVSMILMEIPK